MCRNSDSFSPNQIRPVSATTRDSFQSGAQPIRGGAQNNAADVLTGNPTGFIVDQRAQLTAIE